MSKPLILMQLTKWYKIVPYNIHEQYLYSGFYTNCTGVKQSLRVHQGCTGVKSPHE